jgi:hypothetical protein
MSTEKNLRGKNETLRIVGLYAFLFYVVSVVTYVVLIIKGKDAPCFLIIIGVAACIFVLAFLVFAGILMFGKIKNDDSATSEHEKPQPEDAVSRDKAQQVSMKAEISFDQNQ